MTPTDTDGWIVLLFWLFTALSVAFGAVCVPVMAMERFGGRGGENEREDETQVQMGS